MGQPVTKCKTKNTKTHRPECRDIGRRMDRCFYAGEKSRGVIRDRNSRQRRNNQEGRGGRKGRKQTKKMP